MCKRYIFGFGNYAKNDDGIGLRVVEHIASNNSETDFETIEIGNDGMTLLTYFRDDTAKMLIIDCALIGKKAGEFIIFAPDDVITKKNVANVSTHEGDVLKLIDLAVRLNYPIPEIKIMAIQPDSLEMESTLSDVLKENFATYVDRAIEEINK